MDAFYASVELRRRPDLRGRPVAVGGDGRGVILSATYEARRHGVTSAMPGSQARRLCPGLVVLPPDFDSYTEVSTMVMAIFRDVTPVVEPMSLDEAFLDVAGSIRLLGPPRRIAEAIRQRVHDDAGITCSVGAGASKLVAKIASRHAKPDGVVVVPAEATVPFLHALPVARMWGIGQRTTERLARIGVETVSDLAHVRVSALHKAFGRNAGQSLHDLAWGHDGRRVRTGRRERSVGAEETFGRDLDDPASIRREFLRLAYRVGKRLRKAGLVGRTVTIRVRFATFATITRSRTLTEPAASARAIYLVACSLYSDLGIDRARLRLVGIRMSGLVDAAAARQPELFDPEFGWPEVETAAAAAATRFGATVVRPAGLVDGNRRGHDSGRDLDTDPVDDRDGLGTHL